MAKKYNRNIHSSTVRRMMSLRHFDFKHKLLTYALNNNCKVHIVNESYTSKICGQCGAENKTLGSDTTFICNTCALQIDRDIHAARNICIKNCTPSMVHGG